MRYGTIDKLMEKLVIVRGGGDLATGTIHKLHRSGFAVVILETEKPSAIRRNVALSEAVYDNIAIVEDLSAVRVVNWDDAVAIIQSGGVPLMIDPQAALLKTVKPMALVDAIIAKKNLGTHRNMAPITVALGPGFEAGKDVDIVIETARGHNLGRLIFDGFAKKNTGIPGPIGGYDKERVIHAPVGGTVLNIRKISDIVEAGEPIALIGETAVPATISGVLRGLIRNGYEVTKGFKIADIDPRIEEKENCFTISDKARCLAGSVLEAILYLNHSENKEI